MRLKEIKPGMVIHCNDRNEIKAISDAGFVGISGGLITEYMTPECYVIIKKEYADWALDKNLALRYGNIIEFSDLILPEPTAEEAFRICGELCKEHSFQGYGCDSKCPFAHHDMSCTFYRSQNPEKAIEILAQWKSDHEKKEPEIETVDICRIIEIQPDGRKRCVHEEDISDGELMYSGDAVEKCRYILKNYCMEHDGEFIAVHEVVSRVKR